MPTVEVNGGVTIFYREAGEGDPVVLIQGLEVDHRGWAVQVPALRDHFRCISFDNRDVGGSSFVTDEYSTVDMMNDTVGLMDALGLDSAHIVGFSMGGAIAQELAIRHPERVRKLALLGTFASSDTRFRAINQSRAVLRAKLDLETYTRANFPTVYTSRDYEVPDLIETTIQRVLANPNPQPADAFARQVAAINSHHSADRLSQIAAPTLVLSGEEDYLCPPKLAREIHEGIPGSELVLIPEAGHGVIWTRGPEVNEPLLRFLRP